MLEELWQSMTHDVENSGFTPDWHLRELEQREQNIEEGTSKFSDLESAKSRLQKLL
jgi:hypothetical protein